MSTRSSISIIKEDGSINQIYAHWDGFISHNGVILFNYYRTPEKVNELINLGNLSYLQPEVKPKGKHSYDQPEEGVTIFYHRDRNEQTHFQTKRFKDIETFMMRGNFQDYDYVFKENIQELFNFSKNYFSLILSNKKLSFDDCIKKELKNFNDKFGFKNFFFRKPITINEKITLLKNIDILKDVLLEMSDDLELSNNQLSMNGMISISLESNILGYSSAAAYMNHKEDNYIISLGKYKNKKELKESFIHEWAHCLDYSYDGERKNKSKNWTHSTDAIFNIVNNQQQNNEIETIMKKNLNLENYFDKFKDIKLNMIKEFNNAILPLFDINYSINIFEKHEDMFQLIMSNYYKINTIEMISLLVYSSCFDNGKIEDYVRIKNDKQFTKENGQELFLKIDKKIEELRHKYNYVESNNVGFFVDEKFHDLLMHDFFEKKHYYLKPTEVMARSFELIYKEKSTLGYQVLNDKEKEDQKKLIKEFVNKIIPKNNINLKKVFK